MENATARKETAKTKYGFKRELPVSFERAVDATREALISEGFGVLSEIRIDEKLKEKLGIDFRKYIILGACNPPLAYKTLEQDIDIGLLLPCNVIVYESESSPASSVVAAIDADAMMSVVEGSPAIAAVAGIVNEKLQRALASI